MQQPDLVVPLGMILVEEVVFNSWDTHCQRCQHLFLQCAAFLEEFIGAISESGKFVFGQPDVTQAGGGRVVSQVERFFEIWGYLAEFSQFLWVKFLGFLNDNLKLEARDRGTNHLRDLLFAYTAIASMPPGFLGTGRKHLVFFRQGEEFV